MAAEDRSQGGHDRRRIAVVGAVVAVVAVVVGAVVVLGGRGGEPDAPTGPPSSASPGTAPAATDPDPARAVLTGLPAAGPDRAALLVKIDNVDAARPQRGLAAADVVLEELVEGGLTRLVAVYSSTDPGDVGPVRSVRESDLELAGLFDRPALVYSGGAGPVIGLLRAAADQRRLVSVSPDDAPDRFERRPGKVAPHNLYADAAGLWAFAKEAQSPAPLFAFGPAAPSTPASELSVAFPSTLVGYRWDGATGTWLRSQNGTPQVDEATGATVGFTNVVVLDTRYTTSSTNALSPEVDLAVGGPAKIYRNGSVAACTWIVGPRGQPRLGLRSSTGTACALESGRTIVELRPR